MIFRITYWDAGDKYRIAEVEAASIDAAIEMLVNDEQHPLAQEGTVEVLDDEASDG